MTLSDIMEKNKERLAKSHDLAPSPDRNRSTSPGSKMGSEVAIQPRCDYDLIEVWF